VALGAYGARWRSMWPTTAASVNISPLIDALLDTLNTLGAATPLLSEAGYFLVAEDGRQIIADSS
jgi:hypothetical protein